MSWVTLDMSNYDVAIIGGGITGLTAAHQLALQGRNVVLIEPQELGGVLQSTSVDGFTLELGPNVLVEQPEVLALIKSLGLSDRVRYPAADPYAQYVWHRGGAVEVPKTPKALATSPLLSTYAKSRLLRGLFSKGGVKRDQGTASVAEFFGNLLGKQVVQRLIDPVLGGIYGGDVSKLQARQVFPELWSHIQEGKSLASYAKAKKIAGRKTFVLEGGNSCLVSALAEELHQNSVVLKDEAVDIEFDADHHIFTIHTKNQRALRAERVAIATSGRGTAGFIRNLDSVLAEDLLSLRYAPITVVHCAVSSDIELPKDGFGVLMPSSDSGQILGIMFNSLLFPHLAPEGEQLLTLCFGGMCTPENAELEGDILDEVVAKELGRRLGAESYRILSVKKWSKAIPQFESGHDRRIERMRSLEARLPGLSFIGVDTGGVGVPSRVRAAVEYSKKLPEIGVCARVDAVV